MLSPFSLSLNYFTSVWIMILPLLFLRLLGKVKKRVPLGYFHENLKLNDW